MVTLRTQPVDCYTRGGAYTVGPTYGGHSWDTAGWLLNRGDLLIQWNLYIIAVTLGTQPVDCYTRGGAYTVGPTYGGHSWDTAGWLLNRGDLLIQWNLYTVVTLNQCPVAITQLVIFRNLQYYNFQEAHAG